MQDLFTRWSLGIHFERSVDIELDSEGIPYWKQDYPEGRVVTWESEPPDAVEGHLGYINIVDQLVIIDRLGFFYGTAARTGISSFIKFRIAETSVPIWLVGVLSGILPALETRRQLQSRASPPRAMCNCGYDLRPRLGDVPNAEPSSTEVHPDEANVCSYSGHCSRSSFASQSWCFGCAADSGVTGIRIRLSPSSNLLFADAGHLGISRISSGPSNVFESNQWAQPMRDEEASPLHAHSARRFRKNLHRPRTLIFLPKKESRVRQRDLNLIWR